MSGFSFPPPPPPPPKPGPAGPQQNLPQRGGREAGRGRPRGDVHGRGGRGRGQGSAQAYGGRQQPQTGPRISAGPEAPWTAHAYGNRTAPGNFSSPANDLNGSPGESPPRTAAGHKRKLDALRGPPSKKPEKKPAPETAPSIPTFGAPILANPAASTSGNIGAKQHKPIRALGLTPGAGDPHYSSSDDENDGQEFDEEALYAELGDKLAFEHNGVVMSLSSQADLLAWKKERQKNWPTKARMETKYEERRRVGAERRRLLAGADTLSNHRSQFRKPGSNMWTSTNVEDQNEAQQAGGDRLDEAIKTPKTELEMAKREMAEKTKRLEELRRKVAESEIRNRQARERMDHDAADAEASALPDTAEGGTINVLHDHEKDNVTEPHAQQPIVDEADTEASSDVSSVAGIDSSSEEDSVSDDSPDETTSKPSAALEIATERGPPICRYFRASGWCRDGDACRFKHDAQHAADRQAPPQSNERPPRDRHAPKLEQATQKKTIFQRLVEQEEEEDDRLALKVIKYLGEAGLF